MRDDSGFTLIELLIVVGVIGILAAIAIPSLLRARISGNEASAIASVRTIHSAEVTYAATCGFGGYAASLADLEKPPTGGTAFVPADLAGAVPGATPKGGYLFTLEGAGADVTPAAETCNGATAASRIGFFLQADPDGPGTTGVRHFATDHAGHIRQHTAQLIDISAGTPLQ